ncbi:dedicator of cytokinesis protein 1-like isoform X2 [Antedon mediterranea]|uniref:dedicator of cytokinesis protein 1-like isoform X2 n=1 Tax=Antedon mediterranea TaxID=105859 RepID=UPI003AF43484
MPQWVQTNTDEKYGVVVYNFIADQDETKCELSLDVGDIVYIIEECEGWYRGYCTKNKALKGIFPKSFIQLKEATVELNGNDQEQVTPKESPVVKEVTSVLREWGIIWRDLFIQQKMKMFEDIRQMMFEMIDKRRQILSGTLPVDDMKELKQFVTSKIDYGNRLLDLDLVVRDQDGGVQNPKQLSTLEIYDEHVRATQRIRHEYQETMGSELHVNKKKTLASQSSSIFVFIKNFVCNVGDDTDILISLYDAKLGQFFSEFYIVKWSRKVRNIDDLYNLKCLYTDLGANDLKREKAYLVCQIVRIGIMETKDGDHGRKRTQGLRRPFGVAALDITEVMNGNTEVDEDKQFFVPFLQSSGEEFLETLIKRYISSPKDFNHKGQGLWISLKMLQGDFKQVIKEYPHLVNEKTAIARKMGFPEVIMPGKVRNDIYITLIQGEFEKGSKKTYKNVQVTMEVCTRDGRVLEDVLYPGAGDPATSVYKSVVYYQIKCPKWFETVKVSLPIDVLDNGLHIRFTFKHRSSTESKDKQEKIFALSFMKLMTDIGTTVTNDTHDILIYKVDSHFSLNKPQTYLDLPSSKQELEIRKQEGDKKYMSGSRTNLHSGGLTLSTKEGFQISTVVCSTKLTQNVDLLGLLKWRVDKGDLQKKLELLMQADGNEIVKFLQDTLDALFSILNENHESEKYDFLVFDALVFIIGVVNERKFQQFRPVLDTYITNHFSAALAYNKLMMVLKYYLDNANEHQVQDSLFRALRSLEHIFKFIIRSRQLHVTMYGETQGKQAFESSIRQLFHSINGVMTYDLDTTLRCQGAALKYVPSVIPVTMQMFNPKELASYLRDFIESMSKDRLVKQKLMFMDELVLSDLFAKPECRGIILCTIAQQLKGLIIEQMELQQSGQVLGNILHRLWSNNVGPIHSDISELMKILLRTIIQSVVFMDKESPIVGQFVACMMSLLRQMNEHHYKEYIKTFLTKTDLMDFLMEILMVFRDLIIRNVFPPDWVVMIMQQNSIFLGAMKHFSKQLCETFIREEEFEFQLWNNFFHLSVAFVTQDQLQLEHFSSVKRGKILEIYGDMRRQVGFEIIRSMWYYLGKHKIKFIPEMVGPFLEVTLIPEVELRKAIIPIFCDMMQCEFNIRKDFREFETAVISQLDVLIEGGSGDEKYKHLFYTIVGDFCRKHQFLHQEGIRFVELISKLMDRLLDYRATLHDENKENKMSCTVNLLNFYKDIERQEMYVRYLYKLADLHLDCDNFTEAGFTLLLHADKLKWSDKKLLGQFAKFPHVHTERELREALYYNVMEYFDSGKMWEKAIALCKKLVDQCEKETFNYQQLSAILVRQASYYDNILQKPRLTPEYFKVYYIGLNFPPFLRNKEFIFRGKEYERLADFVARLQQQFPNAQLMNKTTPPDADLKMNKGQILQIVPVQPMRETKSEFRGKMICDQILSYYEVNEVQRFTYSRPFHKGQKDKENEFATMWIERTYYVTNYELPGILRWFEVISQNTEEISPLRNAIETMEEENKKLKRVITQHQANANLPINPLSLQLNGVIDAAVMGGPAMYERAFCTEQYISQHPEDTVLITRLKDLFAEQIPLLELGLQVHSQKMPENLKKLQEKMDKIFSERKQSVEQKYGKKIIEDLPSSDKLRRQHLISGVSGNSRPTSVWSTSSNSSGDTPSSRNSIISMSDQLSISSGKGGTPQKEKSSTPGKNAKRNSRADVHVDDSKVNNHTNSNYRESGPEPIILEEKLQSRRPRRKEKTQSRALRPKTMHVINQMNEKPPLLPPKQAYADYTNLPDNGMVPQKDPGPSPSPVTKDKPPPPLPVKAAYSPPVHRKDTKS